MSNKIAVVSAYFALDGLLLDKLSRNFEKLETADYYLFTNDASKFQDASSDWIIIEIDCSGVQNGVYMTKRVKWLTHEYLPDYNTIIWIDSFIVPNFNKSKEIYDIIDACMKDANAPIQMRTQRFQCIYDDIAWCVQYKRISKTMGQNVINYIEGVEGMCVKMPIQTYWSSAIVKNNKHPVLREMSKDLCNYINTVCYRDQHIIPVLLKKYSLTCPIIEDHSLFIKKGQQFGYHNYLDVIKDPC